MVVRMLIAGWAACSPGTVMADPPVSLPKKAEDILKIYEEMLPKTKLPEALNKLKASVTGVLDAEITAEAARDKKSPVLQALLQRRLEITPLDLVKFNFNDLKPEVDGVKVMPGLDLSTHCLLSPPIKLEASVRATKGNLRLLAGADEIIFGWEANSSELRIGGGPANGRHVAKQGRIPTNSFFTVEQEITDKFMVVKIAGKERAKWFGDFSKISEQAGMFTAFDSQLTVRYCKVSGKVTGMPK
jgi:hypothetical protein